MLFATLDDGSAKIEVSIRAEVGQTQEPIKERQLLVVEGLVEKDDYSDSIVQNDHDRILTFDQARYEYIKNIKIKLDDSNEDHENVVSNLKQIANSSEGNTVLIYKSLSAKAEIALPNKYTIKLDDSSIRALDKRFGAENVEFVYHSQTHVN